MIRCAKCKMITQFKEPTALLVKMEVHLDSEGNEKEDIISQKIVCMNCRRKKWR